MPGQPFAVGAGPPAPARRLTWRVRAARALIARLLGSFGACLGLAVLVMLATASTAAAWSTGQAAASPAAATSTASTTAIVEGNTADGPRLGRDVADSSPALGTWSPPEPEPDDDDGASEASAPAPALCGDAVVVVPSCTHVDLHRMCVSTGLGRGPPTRHR